MRISHVLNTQVRLDGRGGHRLGYGMQCPTLGLSPAALSCISFFWKRSSKLTLWITRFLCSKVQTSQCHLRKFLVGKWLTRRNMIIQSNFRLSIHSSTLVVSPSQVPIWLRSKKPSIFCRGSSNFQYNLRH